MTSEATPGTATIRLRREPGGWRDRAARYKVVLDGETVGRIANGQELDFTVEPGQHRVHLASSPSFYRSPERIVTVNENGTVVLRCRPGGSAAAALLSLFNPQDYISLDVEPGSA